MVDTVTTVERLAGLQLLSSRVIALSFAIDLKLGLDLGYTPFEEKNSLRR